MSHPHPDLDAPGPLAPGALRVIPLGGLGEVGRNMTVFEYDGKLLIVDCGVLFPDENQPGVDLILPDFQPIRDRLDDVVAVVLTHGHEDHIGGRALPAARAGRHPGDRLAAHARAARGQAEGAPAPQRAAADRGRGRDGAVRPVRLRVHRGQPLDPGRARGGDPDPGRPGAAHRRLQDGPVAAGQPDHRPARVRPARRGGRRPVLRRLHQLRGARLHHPRARHRAGARRGLHQGEEPAHHRRLLRLARAPRPAGDGRRREAPPQGRVRRPLDGPQHGSRPGSRLPDRPRRHADRHARARQLSAGAGRAGVHRFAGRADVGTVADRGQRPPRSPDPAGRHRRTGVVADPGQRELGVPGDQRADPARRERDPQGQRAGARVRSRAAPASCCTATTSSSRAT